MTPQVAETYLDYNATTPVDPRVLEAMLPYLRGNYHNPSSFYHPAQRVRMDLEEARAEVARLVGAKPSEVVFTGSGTESDNLAILGYLGRSPRDKDHLITSVIEHPAVLEAARAWKKQGGKVTFLPVDGKGLVDPDALKAAIGSRTALISIMHGNNETGTLQRLADLTAIAREYNIPLHTDAVQTTGKIPIDFAALGLSMLSFSGHKLYGPKGIGVLVIRKGVKLTPLIHGGGQENGMRSGTENTASIIGLSLACRLAAEEMDEEARRLRTLRDRLQEGLFHAIPHLLLNGSDPDRLYNTLNISVRFIEGEGMLAFLDQKGIRISSGSACSTKSLEPSHVLLALGRDHADAHGSLRISLGRFTQEQDIDHILKTLPPIVERLRSMSPFWPPRSEA